MSPLHVYRSNNPNILLTALSNLMEVPTGDPWSESCVVVGNQGVAEAVRYGIAQARGICARVRFVDLFTVGRKILAAILNEDESLTSLWHHDLLEWSLIDLFSELKSLSPEDEAILQPITSYLKDVPLSSRRAFHLASVLARLFRRYMLFRPDVTRAWTNGSISKVESKLDAANFKVVAWQRWIFSRLQKRFSEQARESDSQLRARHEATRIQAALDKLKTANPKELQAILERFGFERLFLIGFVSIPKEFMSLFLALSDKLPNFEIHAFFNAPTSGYTSDLSKTSQQTDPGPALLAAFGTPLKIMDDFLGNPEEFWEGGQIDEPLGSHLSQSIKKKTTLSLLQENLCSQKQWKPIELPDKDSIVFHSCYGPMRQVEALREVLCDLMSNDKSLQPHDVLVLTPDLETYAPLCEAVFSEPMRLLVHDGSKDVECELEPWPFRIVGHSLREAHPIAQAILDIFALKHRRAASAVCSLLEYEAIALKFGFDSADLPMIRDLLDSLGVRFGRDAEHKERLGAANEAMFSWRFGLERLALSLAMDDDGSDGYLGRVPLPGIDGDNRSCCKRFLYFCETLFEICDALDQAHLPSEWGRLFAGDPENPQENSGFLDRLFAVEEGQAWGISRVRRIFSTLAQAESKTEVESDAIYAWLEAYFQKSIDSGAKTLTNLVISDINSMQGVRRRLVCLLGMDEANFPRKSSRYAFDLMNIAPEKGDMDERTEDRYRFLDVLISADDKIEIFYTGRDVRTNDPCYPSHPIDEFRSILDQAFLRGENGQPASALLTREHRLQPFSREHFRNDFKEIQSFDLRMLEGAKALQSETTKRSLFESQLPDVANRKKSLSAEALARFLLRPQRGLITERLGANIPKIEDSEISDRSSLTLNGLECFQVETALVQFAEDHQEPDWEQIESRLFGSAMLPPGAPGKAAFLRAEQVITQGIELFEKLHLGLTEAPPLPLEVRIKEIVLHTQISGIIGKNSLKLVVGQLKGKRLLLPWINLLIWTVASRGAAHAIQLVFCHSKNSSHAVQLALSGSNDFERLEYAESLLEKLISIYELGFCKPLKLFENTSFAYAQCILKGEELSKVLDKCRKCYEGEYQKPGERDSYEIQQCFGDESAIFESQNAFNSDFQDYAQIVWGELLTHMTELEGGAQ